MSVGGKGLEEVEDVLLGAVEGAVELDAGIAVVGVEPGEKVEVVGMDGLRGLCRRSRIIVAEATRPY